MSIDKLQASIEQAREHAKHVLDTRCLVAGVLSGAVGVTTSELEFPEPDVMHAYMCMFGHRGGEPVVYKLIFRGDVPTKWVGISHPWGMKPADIELGR